MKQPFTTKSMDTIEMLWIEVDSIYQQITPVSGQSFVLYFFMLLNRKFAESLFVTCV